MSDDYKSTSKATVDGLNKKVPNEITFEADKLTVGSDMLCLQFKDAALDLDKVLKLTFIIKGVTYKFIKDTR